MLNHYSQLITFSLTTLCISFAIAALCLVLIHKSSRSFLSYLFVESPKSPTGARLLGGLAISMGIIASSSIIFFLNKNFLPGKESSLILPFIVSAAIITAAGYVDDKFEIRARYKLLLQLISVSFLTFQSAQFLGNKHVMAAYIIVTLVGFLLVNGSNLLDGLDTLAIKLSLVTSGAFIYLGFYSGSSFTILLSMATFGGLGAFYFYNRAPAKIYLGEIGGSLIGLIFTAQTILCYQNLRTMQVSLSAMSLILIAISLPICELGVSFLRRIYFNKSPFKGDKLHLHYVIKTKSRLSANSVTNVMALGNLSILISGFFLAHVTSPVIAIVIVNALYCAIYVGYCKSEWIKGQDSKSISDIFEGLQNKSVYLIDSSDLDRVSFKLITDELSVDRKTNFAKKVA